jgi:Cd2+/Zn2+-exporting ATPase
MENSKSALNELVSRSPKTAILKSTGEEVDVATVAVNTVILVKPHEMIPLDGIVETGLTSIDESSITGEPIPREKHPGDMVFAGTLNKSGYIEIITTKTSENTTFSKIIRMTFEAGENRSNSQRFIQKFARCYTPTVVILSALIFIVPVLFLHENLYTWLEQAITLLVISCPCALVISTPVAIYAAIGNAGKKGALVKGGKYLETFADVKVIGLDKTRTITSGNPVVSDVIPLNVRSKEELLACCAGAELFSEHPLAQAIVDTSRREGFEPHLAENYQSILGKGLKANCLVCEHRSILAGNSNFIKEYETITPEMEQIIERLHHEGKTSVVVSFGNGVAGIIGLMDDVKPESAEIVAQIKSLGVRPVMITGDNTQSALYVAGLTGIEDVYGDCLPEDKAAKIKELQAQYKKVAMVGDGVNDAPAMALSDVGIALGVAGSDTAIETANIALMNDRLSLIPYLIKLSRATLQKIKINIFAAIFVKLLFILLAIFGYSNLVMAIVADVGITIAVIVHSLMLLRFNPSVHKN